MKAHGFIKSGVDTCIFLKDGIICLIYVDDTILFTKDQNILGDIITLFKEDCDRTDEGDVDTFLSINFEYTSDVSIKMSQPGLIDKIMEDIGLANDSK